MSKIQHFDNFVLRSGFLGNYSACGSLNIQDLWVLCFIKLADLQPIIPQFFWHILFPLLLGILNILQLLNMSLKAFFFFFNLFFGFSLDDFYLTCFNSVILFCSILSQSHSEFVIFQYCISYSSISTWLFVSYEIL